MWPQKHFIGVEKHPILISYAGSGRTAFFTASYMSEFLHLQENAAPVPMKRTDLTESEHYRRKKKYGIPALASYCPRPICLE